MLGAGALGLIGSGISAVGGLIGSYMNNKAAKEADERNLEFQRENLDYQKHLQQQIFEREDTAHQREVTDLRAAGLNPLLSTGSGAQAGSVVPTEAMQSTYRQDYSGLTQGFISAGEGLASMARYREELDMKREMQQEQLLNMRAQRQKIAADTMNSLLGYDRGNADFSEWLDSSEHRLKMRDYEEELKELEKQEKSGRISHAEADERRKELQESREAGIYTQNMEFAKKHERPYGSTPTGWENALDVIARIYDKHDGGVNFARDIVSDIRSTLKGQADLQRSNKERKMLENVYQGVLSPEYSGQTFDEKWKHVQNAARLLGIHNLGESDKKHFENYINEFSAESNKKTKKASRRR